MKKTTFLTSSGLLLFGLSVISQYSSATGFLPQEPRAMAMGGAGVAVGNSRQAHYYNPSLLVNAREDEDFNFEIDAAVRLSDSDGLADGVSDFVDDNPSTALFNSFIEYDTARQQGDPDATVIALHAMGSATKTLQDLLPGVTGKSLTADGNLGVFASVPNKNISWAAYGNLWTNIGSQGNLAPDDNALMTDVVTISESVNNATDLDNLTADQLNTLITFDPEQSLESSISIKGIAVREIGIALAKKQTINNYDLNIGLTPKILMTTTFGIERNLKQIEDGLELTEQDNTINSTKFNIDLGISKALDENMTTGLVIKNLIPLSFDRDIKIAPAARIGMAWRNSWVATGIDLDLTKNQDAASLTETRFLSLGAEADVLFLQLRGGYRHNFAGSGGGGPSVGLGLYLGGLNLDAAIATNSVYPSEITNADNLNASAQLGFNW